MTEDTSIMVNSICRACIYRICRLIIPPDYYWEEMGEELEDDDSEYQVIEHNYCKILEAPLDHIVIDCNKFVPVDDVVIIKNEQMLGS